MEHGTNENPSIDKLNRASLGLSQPTVQRQTGRRRDLRNRFNFSFLHQSLSWLVLFLTVEAKYIIHYIILYTLYFLSKSCLSHCALAYSLLFWVVTQLFLQADVSLFLLFLFLFWVFFLLNLSISYSSWLDDCCREMSPRFLSSADLHVTEGLLVIQVLRLSISAQCIE